MPILQLKHNDEAKEIAFEIQFLQSLSIQQRFQMMQQKTKEMRALLPRNERRKTTQIIKRT
jgi:hypothetical protein